MAERAPTDRDRGFALMEYIITIAVMGIITAVLCSSIVMVLRNQNSSKERNDASNGALGLINYFPTDVASTPPGGRESTASLTTGCSGYSDTGFNIVRLTWTETLFGSTTTYRVAYRLVDGGDGAAEVLRVACTSTGGSFGSADVRTVAGLLAPLPVVWLAGDAPAALTPLSGDGALTLTLTSANGDLVNVQGTRHNPATELAPYVAPTPNAAMEVSYTLPVSNYSTVGEVLTYSITISNSGAVPLTSVGYTLDNAAAGTSCATTLSTGVTTTCTATHTVTQTDLDTGTVSTKILSYGYYGLTSVSASATNSITAAPAPGVSVLLSTTSPGYTAAGDVITYTTTITNGGNITLTNLLSSYSGSTETVGCSPVPLPPGSSASCTSTHTVTAAELGTTISNVATVTGVTANFGDTAATSSAAVDSPFLAIPKISVTSFTASPSPITTLGQTVTFTVTLQNSGNYEISSLSLSYSNSTEATSCATSVAIAATTSCTSTHVVTQTDLDSGGFDDTVSVTAYYLTNQATATATAQVAGSAIPTISVLLTTTEASYKTVGDVLHYTLSITNTGNVSLWNLNRTFADAVGGAACAPQPLSPAATATCTATHTVTAGEYGGAISVSANAQGWNPFYGYSTTESTATLSTQFAVQPKITITGFAASPSPFSGSGQTVTYTVSLRNDGNVALSAVSVSYSNAAAATSCAATLAAGATTSCTATYTTTSADATSGGVTNIASATGTYNGTAYTSQSTITVPVSLPCTVTSSTTSAIGSPTSVGRVTNNSDGKKDMLLSDVLVTISTSGACSGLRIKYYPKTPSSVVADMSQNGSTWTFTIPGEASADAAKWNSGETQVQVLPAASVGSTAIFTNSSAFTVT